MRILLKFALLLVLFGFTENLSAQQTDRDRGIELYKKKDYKGALNVLKKAVKEDKKDARSWNFLGLIYINEGEEKNAVNALEKAALLNPADAQIKNALAYAYILKNELNKASNEALAALELDPKLAESQYVLGIVAFRNEIYDNAHDRAIKAIEINPKMAQAYLLKSEALVASFTKQYRTVSNSTANRKEILKEAETDLQKFVSLMPNLKNINYYNEYLDSIRFFAGYYESKDIQKAKSADPEQKPSDTATGFKIHAKPRASYTDKARQYGVSGNVSLLVGFEADGTIKHVLILNPLGFGLNEEAVKAVRGIRFSPATENGKPVSVVKQVIYSFTIY